MKPLPSLTFELYFCVGQCTRGRRAPEMGRGAILAALVFRVSLRIFFCAGWSSHVLTRRCHFLWKCWFGITLLCFTMAASGRLGRGSESEREIKMGPVGLATTPPCTAHLSPTRRHSGSAYLVATAAPATAVVYWILMVGYRKRPSVREGSPSPFRFF